MKKVAIFMAVWLCFTTAYSQQKIEKHMSFSGKESLELEIQIADSINIKTWNKNEIYAVASVNINENKDNEAYQISFGEAGKTVEIRANFTKDYYKGRNSCCDKTAIAWQIYIPEKTVFSLETINGNITINGVTGEMKIKTISGFIDLAVPSTRRADIEFSTISGTIFTNHSLTMNSKSSFNSSQIKEKLNNGGPMIKLETISGDIFFRESR